MPAVNPPCDWPSAISLCPTASAKMPFKLSPETVRPRARTKTATAPSPRLGGNHDAAAAIHAARCVVDEIREHARQPFRIGVERNRFTRQIDDERMPRGLDPRPRLARRALDDGVEQHALLLELDVSQHDLVGIEQIVR